MNTESVDCRRVSSNEFTKPGDFRFVEDGGVLHLYIWLPGDSGPDAIMVRRGDPGGSRVWGWDGNEERPTVKPSILAPGRWHGWLKNGRLESC